MVQFFFYPMKLFFVIKKMNGLKPTECFYFRKKRGRFLTFDWSKQRSTTHQNLSFFEAVKRNRIGWDGGIFSSFFFFFLPTISPLLSNLPLFHFYLSCVSIFPSRVCPPYYLLTLNFKPPLVVCDVWLGSETRFFTPL